MNRPTQDYTALDRAYDHFNASLFGGKLPNCLITLQRQHGARGYFSPQRFASRKENAEIRTDEIALNPDNFPGRTDKDILSTLAHEMAHLWQEHYGKPGRGKYHNGEWAKKMLEIGLTPVSIDKPGSMTGQKVTHDINPGGPFDQACDLLLSAGLALGWESMKSLSLDSTRTSKQKYTCPTCSQNTWAKPDANLICGDCMETMTAA